MESSHDSDNGGDVNKTSGEETKRIASMRSASSRVMGHLEPQLLQPLLQLPNSDAGSLKLSL